MAERRMFAKAIIGSAKFLRMPASARLLYYDLGMEADDDGCVEAFSIMRKTGAAEDDLRVLHSKGFVRVLNDDLVSYISDWNVNNRIRKDRYRPGLYTDLLRGSCPVEIDLATTCQPSDNQMATEVRLGKDRLGKVRLEEGTAKRFTPPTIEDVTAYCKERHNGVDPQKWFDHYTSNGWMVGRTKMKDWKAAVRTWEKNAIGKTNGPPCKRRDESVADVDKYMDW